VRTSCHYYVLFKVVLGGVVLNVLAIVLKVRGFKPGLERLIFKSDKNSLHTFLRMGSKAVGPMS
jgi:hypothetical protein